MAIIAEYADQSITYAELNQRANRLAHYFKAIGVSAEQRIAICLERSIDVLVVMVAILKAGACYVPLDPKQPLDRLSFILNDCQARLCITQSCFRLLFHAQKTEVIAYDECDLSAYPISNLDEEVATNQLAYVIYTSGTTGKPKGVLIEHQSVVNYTAWFSEFSMAKPLTRIDWSSNYVFDMAVTATIVPMMLGLTIVICSEETQRHFKSYLHHIHEHDVNIIKITPSYFKELIREMKSHFYALTSLRTIVLGGEQLNAHDCITWLAYCPHHTLINEYGPTEATVAFSQYSIDKSTVLSSEMPVPIGVPGEKMYYYILDKERQLVSDTEEGELYIGGLGLARGYLNLPEMTRERFVPDPFNEGMRLYKTGDLCKVLPNGLIEYLGRIDRQVKIRGFRVELNEVEQCLEEHPDIEDAVVFVRESASHDKQLMAYYILSDKNKTLSNKDVRAFMQALLPNYMIPISMVCVDVFPMGANGKLDESALPDAQVSVSKTKAQNKLERTLVKIWSKELGIDSIGVDECFWELGGHSFIAARIMSQMNQIFHVDIKAHQFYEATTIQSMALVVKGMKQHDPLQKDISGRRDEKIIPLSDFQTILWACKTFKPEASKLNIIARKRLQGAFDIAALNFAFDEVLKKHRILSYRISKVLPIQVVEEKKPIHLVEIKLDFMADEELEYALWDSLAELAHFSSWPASYALLRAKLFYLKEDMIELQISIPHIISDGLSIDILLAELSEYYLHWQQRVSHLVATDVVEFSDYIYAEQLQNNPKIRSDLDFWSEYLKDAHLFSFPLNEVVTNRQKRGFAYSSYVPIPSKAVHHLEVFCMHEHVNFNEALCAAIGLSLTNCAGDENANSGPMFMNVVKSARDNFLHDETIGCFIRIEPIKLLLNKAQTLGSLLGQVRAFSAEKTMFQDTLSMLKLASLNRFYRKKKNSAYFMVTGLISIYRHVLRLFKKNHDMLKVFPSLCLLDDKKRFMIYLNIWHNFVNTRQNQANLFGMHAKRIKMYQYDLLAVDYLFEVCFLRDENNKPYIVISSNLTPAFREKIAHEIIRIMNEEMVCFTQAPA